MKYAEKFLDPRWQKLRLEILDRDEWACVECGREEKTLHVHHHSYQESRNPWETPAEDLSTMCADCHYKVTALFKAARQAIQRFGVEALSEITGYIRGMTDSATNFKGGEAGIWTGENYSEAMGYMRARLRSEAVIRFWEKSEKAKQKEEYPEPKPPTEPSESPRR